jgi:hypothetical protein
MTIMSTTSRSRIFRNLRSGRLGLVSGPDMVLLQDGVRRQAPYSVRREYGGRLPYSDQGARISSNRFRVIFMK